MQAQQGRVGFAMQTLLCQAPSQPISQRSLKRIPASSGSDRRDWRSFSKAQEANALARNHLNPRLPTPNSHPPLPPPSRVWRWLQLLWLALSCLSLPFFPPYLVSRVCRLDRLADTWYRVQPFFCRGIFDSARPLFARCVEKKNDLGLLRATKTTVVFFFK